MSVLMNDPSIFWSVVAGLAFLIGLKVVAFLAVRRVMKKKPQGAAADSDG